MSLKHKDNLSDKNIKDFTSEDTIYIRDYEAFNKDTFLCQFISFDAKKNRVTGKIIENNDGRYQRAVDKVITAALKDCGLYGESDMSSTRHGFHWFDGMGYALNPHDAKKSNEKVHCPTHESFAVIRGSRHSSRGTALFGSSIQHNQSISITISTAEHNRSLNNDSIHNKKQIIEIEMSENQFAQFITTMNHGSGIPCTIRHINGKKMSDPPFQTKQELFEAEFQKDMDNYTIDLEKTLANTMAILEKPNIGKEDRKVILSNIQSLVRKLNDDMPFMRTQFREQMDGVVNEAKIQIEAFAENVIRNKGLEALAEKNPDLKDIILELRGKKSEEE